MQQVPHEGAIVIDRSFNGERRRRSVRPALVRATAAAGAVLLGLAGALIGGVGAVAAPAPPLADEDSVYVGDEIQITGSAMIFPVWKQTPADLANPGEPDYWAYCIEQTVSSRDMREAIVGDVGDFLGSNYFASDPSVAGKVLWVLAHSYPALSVADLAVAAGIPGLTFEEAISGTTTAIWRFTDVTWDATYYWVNEDVNDHAERLYRYLIGGAQAGAGMTPADFATNVAITPPAVPQVAGTLVGPFVVSTDRPQVSVSTSPSFVLTDAAGAAIDPAAVVDGQSLYLDARGETAAGSATVTASALGASATGMIVSVPNTPGGIPTAGDHAQSLVLVAAQGATTDAAASVQWSAVATAPSSTTPGAPDRLAPTGGEPQLGLLVGGSLVFAAGAALLLRSRRGGAPVEV